MNVSEIISKDDGFNEMSRSFSKKNISECRLLILEFRRLKINPYQSLGKFSR